MLDHYTDITDDWETVTLELPHPTANYQIAFMGHSNDANGVYVDDVWVGNNPGVGVADHPTLVALASPNPATGTVVIAANVAQATVEVFDLFGRQMASTLLGDGRAELDISAWVQGVYVARISSTEGTTTIRLIKE